MAIDRDPRAEYQRRLAKWLGVKQDEDRRYIRVGNLRLATAGLAALMAWIAYGPGLLSGWWLAAPIVLFAGLVVWHARVAREQLFAGRAIELYQRGLKRLNDEWAGSGESGEALAEPAHIYSADLDLFGKGSLFQMLSTARTRSGEQTLADWLQRPAGWDEVRGRQEAARELADELELREDLALLGTVVRAEIHPDVLEQWGKAPRVVFSPWLRPVAACCAVIAISVIAAFFAGVLPLSALAGSIAVNALLMVWMKRRTAAVTGACGVPGADLQVLSVLLERLERQSFAAPLLKRLRASLNVEGLAASRRIAQLERLMDWLDSAEHHAVMRVIAPVILLREQLAIIIEHWRAQNGGQVGEWLRVCGQFEALASIAALAYERPDWVFPELLSEASPRLEAQGLRHPLIARSRAVANDVSLNNETRVWIVSGSNMSGKSTLLRAIGVNVVLASAGAPVAAGSLRLSELEVGASLRSVDSLQDGRSRFLAEITRIRDIGKRALEGRALLFLLDELLSGTNSHDRRIGAAAIVKGLVDRGAIGLITTHDLALADLEADLEGRARNVHFDDHMAGGHLEFDYKLRPGVVTHSNALELMRAVGLTV